MVGYVLLNRPNGVIHKTMRCRHIVDRVVIEVDERGRAQCHACWRVQNMCMICGDTITKSWRGCENHTLCLQCLRDHTMHQLENPNWDGKIFCPCGSPARQDLPLTLQKVVNNRLQPNDHTHRNSRDSLQQVIELALTHRCPHCHSAFYEFTGCAAVLCRCGKYFCACCLAPCSSNEDCHDHVRACWYNHKRNYWIDTKTLEQIMHDRRCIRAWLVIGKILKETQSVVYAWGVALRVAAVDSTALLPYYLRAVTCVPTIVWWCLLCFAYPFEAFVIGIAFYAIKYAICT